MGFDHALIDSRMGHHALIALLLNVLDIIFPTEPIASCQGTLVQVLVPVQVLLLSSYREAHVSCHLHLPELSACKCMTCSRCVSSGWHCKAGAYKPSLAGAVQKDSDQVQQRWTTIHTCACDEDTAIQLTISPRHQGRHSIIVHQQQSLHFSITHLHCSASCTMQAVCCTPVEMQGTGL